MWKALGIVIVIAISSIALAQPQGPDTVWTRTFGGAGDQSAWAVLPSSGGGVWVAHNSGLMMLSSQGDSLWSRDSLDTGHTAQRLVRCGDHGCNIVGYLANNARVYDDTGALLRSATVPWGWSEDGPGGHYGAFVTTMTIGACGSYCLGGWWISYYPPHSQTGDFVQLRDSTGQILASNESLPDGEPQAVLRLHNGDVVIIQNVAGDSSGHQMRLTQYDDSLRGVRWTRVATLPGWWGNGWTSQLVESPDGHIVTGCTMGIGIDSMCIFLMKLSVATGDTLWTQVISQAYSSVFSRVIALTNNDLVVCSSAGGSTWPNRLDVMLQRVASNGTVMWSRTYGGQLDDRGADVAVTDDGGYIIAATTRSFGAGGSDIWVIKTAPDPLSAVGPVEIMLPQKLELYANFPNPFNPSTQIAFDLPRAGRAMLKVFDLNGRHVATLADGQFSVGHHEVSFDGHELASGVYFYQLSSNHQTQTRKMLLLK